MKDDLDTRMFAALRDFPADGRPDRTQDPDTMLHLITRGYIQRHEQMKSCSCCGNEKMDYAYFRMTVPGRTFLEQTARIEKLEAALRPFAAVAVDYDERGLWSGLDDGHFVVGRIRRHPQEDQPPAVTIADMRNVAALTSTREGLTGGEEG